MSKTLTRIILERELLVRESIEEYSELFDVDPNLVRAVITQESLFISEARSPTGAYGYGQFTHIGAKQVQLIARMNSHAQDLANYTKDEANDSVRGIKAICAYLWWLFYRKYKGVTDKKVQVEAVLTFYNSGGKAAALVVKHGGHTAALPHIRKLEAKYRSQAEKYAPETLEWFIAWHDYLKEARAPEPTSMPTMVMEGENPFPSMVVRHDTLYRALIEALAAVAQSDSSILFAKNVRDGLTEVTLVFRGEY